MDERACVLQVRFFSCADVSTYDRQGMVRQCSNRWFISGFSRNDLAAENEMIAITPSIGQDPITDHPVARILIHLVAVGTLIAQYPPHRSVRAH